MQMKHSSNMTPSFPLDEVGPMDSLFAQDK